MVKSIIRTVLLYLCLQLACINLFINSDQVPSVSILVFSLASILLHAALCVFLYGFRSDFFNLSTNKQLDRINLANRITLLRISSLPTMAFFLRHKEIFSLKLILPVLLVLLFLTDSFDGQIARRGNQITKMGQMLDSISDYSLLAVISFIYYINRIVPHWLFYAIFSRLFLQALGMFVFIILKKPLPTASTWGGKVTIATIMSLYVLELVRMFTPPSLDIAFRALEFASGAIIIALSLEKVAIFMRHGKSTSTKRAESRQG